MQKNTLRIFGQLTDLLQATQLEVQDQLDTASLRNWLFSQYPALQGASFVVAVNHSIVQQTTPISEGDTLALMPPFSGG